MARILLIDDEELVRSTVRMMLQRAGHEVTDTGVGQAGLTRFKQHGADLVVIRTGMTAAPGVALAESIRRTDAQVPILLTHQPNGGDESPPVDPERLGAHYLGTPFAADEVTGLVAQLLATPS